MDERREIGTHDLLAYRLTHCACHPKELRWIFLQRVPPTASAASRRCVWKSVVQSARTTRSPLGSLTVPGTRFAFLLTHHLQCDQVLDIDQSHRLSIMIQDGNLIVAVLAHQAHRITHKIINQQMLRSAGHHFIYNAIQAGGIIEHQPSQIAIGEDA